ncbi:YscQ/HrcQ family type III secretion apparatus protein [Chitinimonas arctica]|uniref:YscQ/HrcQ family type III secretion apparatus protein n=1 Tax=Chitinimonas arctica TaxID=2594795 RepID=A0A516SA86_9NEIS|nr:type III secretion system cytoplasmic ring protein SctQ [Chitinimonas arctica]QDQ25063.1 YscQ/HrcQ family type III secretion apparatus protein [Chitinimonas arctica]
MSLADVYDELESLLLLVSSGRTIDTASGDRITLEYKKSGGNGLVLNFRMGDRALSAWVAEHEYCRWIEPMLPVPSADRIPPELFPLLCTWSLAPLDAWLTSLGFEQILGDSIARGEGDAEEGWVLTIEGDRGQLCLSLLDWPLDWLKCIAEQQAPFEMQACEMTAPVCVAAGWTRMTLNNLRSLRIGDGLVLDTSARIDEGEWYLFERKPLARISCAEDDSLATVEELMDDFDDWLNIAEIEKTLGECEPEPFTGVNDIVMTVVAEAGRIELPLSSLASLHEGQLLDANIRHNRDIRLKINGKTIGSGSLVKVGEKLMVRIEKLGL